MNAERSSRPTAATAGRWRRSTTCSWRRSTCWPARATVHADKDHVAHGRWPPAARADPGLRRPAYSVTSTDSATWRARRRPTLVGGADRAGRRGHGGQAGRLRRPGPRGSSSRRSSAAAASTCGSSTARSTPLPANLERLRQRGLGPKRALALREFALGIEALERFVAGEPLYRVHECVFGVLALESEPATRRGQGRDPVSSSTASGEPSTPGRSRATRPTSRTVAGSADGDRPRRRGSGVAFLGPRLVADQADQAASEVAAEPMRSRKLSQVEAAADVGGGVAQRGLKLLDRAPLRRGVVRREQADLGPGLGHDPFFGTEPEFAVEVCNAVMDVWQPAASREIILNLPATVEMCTHRTPTPTSSSGSGRTCTIGRTLRSPCIRTTTEGQRWPQRSWL